MNSFTDDRYLGIKELASFLGVKESTVYAWVHTRKFPYYKIGRLVKFNRKEIMVWLKAVKVDSIS
ncbi:MAG: helix-turn-helix domain-containing protein [Candidatus Omnitrophica bacterium]|nr:helix-turn-helix domain-containing protein [Candidatus Omnitrophota bacterium]